MAAAAGVEGGPRQGSTCQGCSGKRWVLMQLMQRVTPLDVAFSQPQTAVHACMAGLSPSACSSCALQLALRKQRHGHR
jgi:hypothetical protein